VDHPEFAGVAQFGSCETDLSVAAFSSLGLTKLGLLTVGILDIVRIILQVDDLRKNKNRLGPSVAERYLPMSA